MAQAIGLSDNLTMYTPIDYSVDEDHSILCNGGIYNLQLFAMKTGQKWTKSLQKHAKCAYFGLKPVQFVHFSLRAVFRSNTPTSPIPDTYTSKTPACRGLFLYTPADYV